MPKMKDSGGRGDGERQVPVDQFALQPVCFPTAPSACSICMYRSSYILEDSP
jgi:hypothetical protein